MKEHYVAAVIVAAGKGTRMNVPVNKQYLLLHGKPILAHTLEVFENSKLIDEIILVVGEHETNRCMRDVVNPYGFKKIKKLVVGGKTRQQSMYNGLLEVSTGCDIVVTHDGARPLVDPETIHRSIKKTVEFKATVVGVPVKETIKIMDSDGFVDSTPQRDRLWTIQTPQTFAYPLLMEAHRKALVDGYEGTDDAMLVENLGHPIKIIKGYYENIKITTPEDLLIAESIININRYHGKSGL